MAVGPWRRRTRETVYANPWLEVYHDEVDRPDGSPGIYGVVHFRNAAVGVVAVADDGRLLLVGQHRYSLDEYSWEIPEGGVADGFNILVGGKMGSGSYRVATPLDVFVLPHEAATVTGEIVKIFPLAHWTRADVARYLEEHDVPHHPLQDRGYTSIGCWPCTRPTVPGESERAGRWSGTSKKECGLHTFTVKQT